MAGTLGKFLFPFVSTAVLTFSWDGRATSAVGRPLHGREAESTWGQSSRDLAGTGAEWFPRHLHQPRPPLLDLSSGQLRNNCVVVVRTDAENTC